MPQQIISLTKHKNTNSLNHYINGLSTAQKGECSSMLSSSLFSNNNSNQEVSCSTVTARHMNNDQPGPSSTLQQNSWNIQRVPSKGQPILPSGQSFVWSSTDVLQLSCYTVNYTQQDSPKQQVSPCKKRKRLIIYSDDEE